MENVVTGEKSGHVVGRVNGWWVDCNSIEMARMLKEPAVAFKGAYKSLESQLFTYSQPRRVYWPEVMSESSI